MHTPIKYAGRFCTPVKSRTLVRVRVRVRARARVRVRVWVRARESGV